VDTAPSAPIGVAPAREEWSSIDHRVLQRRSRTTRGLVRRRHQADPASRNAFETWRGHVRLVPLSVRGLTLLLGVLACADLLLDAGPLRQLTLISAVCVAGAAALLATARAESAGVDRTRRWHLQAVACAVIMLMLMANGSSGVSGDPLWFLIVVGAASTLVALATSYTEGTRSRIGAVCLSLDSAIVGFTTALITVALAVDVNDVPVGGAAILVGAFAAAAYAVAVATRPAVRADARGSDSLFLTGVLVLCLNAAGLAAREIGFGAAAVLAAPGVALFGALGLARSAWTGPHSSQAVRDVEPSGPTESRLRLVPALAAAGAIGVLSWLELDGRGTRAGFFGVILLFALIVGRLFLTLVENRQLGQRVERSGLFEEKLRDLGGVLVAALDRKNTLELVCRTAQTALAADSVLLWMLDPSTEELEAVEVLGPRRDELLGRRLPLDDLGSLAARVARTGASEIVHNVPSANASNGYLNVRLHAQSLLGVPIVHGGRVEGVLVSVDARSPTAYAQPELSKAELLGSHVAVALDNAYQHALQRRRLEELTALYQFAQSAHNAFSSVEIVRQLLPILKERLHYTSGTIWLRDETIGALRVGAGDGPSGAPRGVRPPPLAKRAFSSGEPVSIGLGWEDDAPLDGEPSELAVPMVIKRHVVGVVHLESRAPRAWSVPEERLLVALANHAALAIDNLHLVDESRKLAALKELDRMKSELLSTVSHELRTPLGSIKGYATTLLTHGNKLRKDEQREFLEIIDSEADRLRELIENLLDMSRLEAGVLRIDRAPVQLGNVARDVARKVQLATPNHTLSVDWPEADPIVNADQKRIYQVIQNLLSNAVKYSPDGGSITLSAHCERRELVVSVADQGLGMPAGELDKIFDRFHRVHGEMTRVIGGTGLGLAICKGLVEAHGGRIWAESEGDGKGSTFRFALPLMADGGEVARTAATPSRSKGAHDHQEANPYRR
jgi:signal transduction histidine kinase